MLQIEIIGNIGNDAEVKNINGKDFVSFSVAHSEKVNGTEHTTWVSALMNGNGGNLLQYLKKGAKVFVRGRGSVKAYTDQSGQAKAATNVYVSEIILCDLKNNGGNTPVNDNPPF